MIQGSKYFDTRAIEVYISQPDDIIDSAVECIETWPAGFLTATVLWVVRTGQTGQYDSQCVY